MLTLLEIPEAYRGTYAGLCFEPVLSHLKELGVTAIELLPIHYHVNARHLIEQELKDYWGYNTLSFFAPETRYAYADNAAGAVQEFKTMVRVLHAHGIEVISVSADSRINFWSLAYTVIFWMWYLITLQKEITWVPCSI